MEVKSDVLKGLIDRFKDTCEVVGLLVQRCIKLEKWLSEERAELNYRIKYPERPWTALGDERQKLIDDAAIELHEEGKL
jgi:hypothetical protein